MTLILACFMVRRFLWVESVVSILAWTQHINGNFDDINIHIRRWHHVRYSRLHGNQQLSCVLCKRCSPVQQLDEEPKRYVSSSEQYCPNRWWVLIMRHAVIRKDYRNVSPNYCRIQWTNYGSITVFAMTAKKAEATSSPNYCKKCHLLCSKPSTRIPLTSMCGATCTLIGDAGTSLPANMTVTLYVPGLGAV